MFPRQTATEERAHPDTDRSLMATSMCLRVKDVQPFAQELRRRGADIVWFARCPQGSNIFIVTTAET